MLQTASVCCGLGGKGVTLASRFERSFVFTFNMSLLSTVCSRYCVAVVV